MTILTENFSGEDRQLIVALAFRLTGSKQDAQSKIDSCLVNIKRRMQTLECISLRDYLAKIEAEPSELAHFISAVTIHTTSWFREMPHFGRLRHLATPAAALFQEGRRKTPFRVLSAGCSTGEEGYSLALVLEDIRQKHPRFDYIVEGWDVDPVSVSVANQAVYNIATQSGIPTEFRRFLLTGTGKTRGYFTLDKEIRRRCKFRRQSLIPTPLSTQTNSDAAKRLEESYDIVFCRNVLIYFDEASVRVIIANLVNRLTEDGHLCLGHSESIEAESFGLKAFGNTTYKKKLLPVEAAVTSVGSVAAPSRTYTQELQELHGNKALSSGFKRQALKRPEIILVGASTGGTEVLIKVLHDMPKPCPPIVVVQHIALAFAKPFAERLAKSAGLVLAAPVPGSILQDNHLYMAWDDYHIGLRRRSNLYVLEIGREGLQHGVRPSVDYLFHSVAKSITIGPVAAVLLTGMGKDGAKGMRALRERGAMTFVQDEASSTVFGMPREAIQLGAAGFVGNPDSIRQQLCQTLNLASAPTKTAI